MCHFCASQLSIVVSAGVSRVLLPVLAAACSEAELSTPPAVREQPRPVLGRNVRVVPAAHARKADCGRSCVRRSRWLLVECSRIHTRGDVRVGLLTRRRPCLAVVTLPNPFRPLLGRFAALEQAFTGRAWAALVPVRVVGRSIIYLSGNVRGSPVPSVALGSITPLQVATGFARVAAQGPRGDATALSQFG